MSIAQDLVTLAGWEIQKGIHGVSATYTDPDGTVTSGLTVVLNTSSANVVEISSDVVEAHEMPATIHVEQADLASPSIRGSFVIGSDTWIVAQYPTPPDNGLWELVCVRRVRDRVGDHRE